MTSTIKTRLTIEILSKWPSSSTKLKKGFKEIVSKVLRMAKSDIDLELRKSSKAKTILIFVTASVEESQIKHVEKVMKNSSSFVASLNKEVPHKLDPKYGISVVDATPPHISGTAVNCILCESY